VIETFTLFIGIFLLPHSELLNCSLDFYINSLNCIASSVDCNMINLKIKLDEIYQKLLKRHF
jgi:hypothetical protein